MSSKPVIEDQVAPLRSARRRFSIEQVRSILGEQAQSGQSMWAFARARGYCYKTLYGWRQRLMRDQNGSVDSLSIQVPLTSSELPAPFVPVRLSLSTTTYPSEQTQADEDGTLELVVAPRRRILIPNSFHESTLLRLLRTLDQEETC